MFDPFSTALSALNANAAAISVTGDNLANLNTVAFKGSRVSFDDLVTQFVTEGLEIGAGVGRPSTSRQYIQGAVEVTGTGLDAALQGNGFFVVRDASDSQLFTRSGNFTTDATGNLVTRGGHNVQGWAAVNGTVTPTGPISDIVLPTSGLLPPIATTEISMRLNLDASAAAGAAFSVPAEIVDSLGATHIVTFNFTKTSATDWDYDVMIPGEDLTSGTAGTPSSLATGTITFGPDGQITAPAAPGITPVAITGFTNGAADVAMDWNLFNGTDSMLTQFSQQSAVSSVSQNGEVPAEMINLEITQGGLVVARFTGGREQVVAQLAVAAIANPGSMASAGNNSFRLTSKSAAPAIGPAGTGGRGDVRGAALESSTVDIASEFTRLIRYQRAYQANSRVVTTADEIAQETLNLKR
ncbi:MAG: flagellar hook protein FlgE [Bryobacterales bacterium]